MASRTLETIDGIEYVFNQEIFHQKMNMKALEAKATHECAGINEYRAQMADSIGVTIDAIKKWNQGKSGPSDIVTLQRAAEFLGVDYHKFLKEKNDMGLYIDKNERFGKEEIETAKRVYESISEYIEHVEQLDSEYKYIEDVETGDRCSISACKNWQDFVNMEMYIGEDVELIGENYKVGIDHWTSGIYSNTRKIIKLSSFDLPENIVSELVSLLVDIHSGELDILMSSNNEEHPFNEENYEKTRGLSSPYKLYCSSQETSLEFYARLDNILGQYFKRS